VIWEQQSRNMWREATISRMPGSETAGPTRRSRPTVQKGHTCYTTMSLSTSLRRESVRQHRKGNTRSQHAALTVKGSDMNNVVQEASRDHAKCCGIELPWHTNDMIAYRSYLTTALPNHFVAHAKHLALSFGLAAKPSVVQAETFISPFTSLSRPEPQYQLH
jgi:hypothetical protein